MVVCLPLLVLWQAGVLSLGTALPTLSWGKQNGWDYDKIAPFSYPRHHNFQWKHLFYYIQQRNSETEFIFETSKVGYWLVHNNLWGTPWSYGESTDQDWGSHEKPGLLWNRSFLFSHIKFFKNTEDTKQNKNKSNDFLNIFLIYFASISEIRRVADGTLQHSCTANKIYDP